MPTSLQRADLETVSVSMPAGTLEREYAEKLSLDLLDDELLADARRMATVYTAIAAFENSARDLVASIMLEGLRDQGERVGHRC